MVRVHCTRRPLTLLHSPPQAEEAEWLRGVAVRLTSRLAHGWAAWLEHCEQCGMARRALAGFSRGAERRGLNSWRGYVDELAARRELLRVAAVRFSSKLDDAWAAWIDFVSERELMQRAAAPMRAVGLKRALNCWAATVEERFERPRLPNSSLWFATSARENEKAHIRRRTYRSHTLVVRCTSQLVTRGAGVQRKRGCVPHPQLCARSP